jgi:hypothetical protein
MLSGFEKLSTGLRLAIATLNHLGNQSKGKGSSQWIGPRKIVELI